MRKGYACWVENKAGRHIGLWWQYCHTKGYVVVFGESPAGDVYMGDTLAEARKCAAETTWAERRKLGDDWSFCWTGELPEREG